MRLSQMLFVTLKEAPEEAEIPSHRLLVLAGYIRHLTSGIYVYLPLMWRVLQNISHIIQEEMNAIGAQECVLPQLQPAQLWVESGRWQAYTEADPIMFAFQDKQGRDLVLSPTHEEVITKIVREMIRSHQQLPLHLYQIKTKFRDEIQPGFGLLRAREFVMKDGYSFHATEESLKKTYGDIYQAYSKIFNRCGLTFQVVDADTGAMGGLSSHEFMVFADAGEDEILYTEDGKYAANIEKAVSLPPEVEPSPFTIYEKREAFGTETVEKICQFLQCSSALVVKNILYQTMFDTGLVVLILISIRGDQEVNEAKLQNELVKLADQYGAKTVLALKVSDAKTQEQWAVKNLPLGYIAPDISDNYIRSDKQLHPKFLRLVDKTAIDLKNFVTGSNELGYHVVGANWGKSFHLPKQVVDVRKANAGERAVHDPSQTLQSTCGIEVGHITQVGIKYSQAMGATYNNELGEEVPLVMGTYGIGVSRLAQAIVEQAHDADGIIWPVTIAPYTVIITIPDITASEQLEVGETLYSQLKQAGIETLLDDRESPMEVKFKDANLIGIPYCIVPGRSLKRGCVEIIDRASHHVKEVPLAEVVPILKEWIHSALNS